MAKSKRPKTKPKKPYKDFPLFPHASGQWAKKIRGRLVYFGVWADHETALRNYLKDKDYLQAGLEPIPDSNSVSVVSLCDQFLKSRKARVESGELRNSTWADYKRSCERSIKAFGRNRPADSIGPTDFTKLRSQITGQLGPVRTGREVTQIRMIFKWGFDQELIPSPRFGSDFKAPSKDVLRRHRQQSPPKFFEAEEIRAMLNIATVHSKAWILLGINCAFIQSDLSNLKLTTINLDNPILDFPRSKTAIERRVVLWPETQAALRDSLANRYTPKLEEDGDKFFVTREGNRLVRNDGVAVRSDAVHQAMNRIQKKLGIKQAKRSFGALRHTFRTVADETRDLPAILRVMGHADHTISDHYRERIADDRIEAVVNHVHDWLFVKTKKSNLAKKGS
jgi:integrase